MRVAKASVVERQRGSLWELYTQTANEPPSGIEFSSASLPAYNSRHCIPRRRH